MAKQYKGEQTREKILMTAIELFGENGFDQVSLKMIGDEVGISQAAVAQHFGNKRNIIFRVREIVSKSNQSFVDAKIQPYDKPVQQLTDYCFANLEWGFKNRRLSQIIVLTYYFSFMDKEFQQAQVRTVQIATDRVEKYVISHFREDKKGKLSETREIANQIHQYVLGLFVREIAWQTKMPPAKELQRQIRSAVEKLLT